MIESIKHAEDEMNYFKQIEPPLSEEVLKIMRLELITAFRAGYALACRNQFDIKPLSNENELILNFKKLIEETENLSKHTEREDWVIGLQGEVRGLKRACVLVKKYFESLIRS